MSVTGAAEWSSVAKTFYNAEERVLGFINFERKEWKKDETWQLIEDRRKLKGELNISCIKN